MNTTKALKQTAPPEILAALGLQEGATIGSALDRALQLLGNTVKTPSVQWTAEEDAALFNKLVGTPEEIVAERKLRELAYTIVARTATREELSCLLEARIIQEPERGAIVVPALRLLQ